MGLLYNYLEKKYEKLQKNNIKLNAIGRLEALPEKVKSRLFDVMQKTSGNKKMVLTLALNYGSRQEILDAVRVIIEDTEKKALPIDSIDEKVFSSYLYTRGLPDIDLLIRTSGEFRLSNFLLWQVSYAEIVITNTLWPDFGKRSLDDALEEYKKRDRRFGGR
jgi:undecaprenyl diphosphate synthase